MPSFKKILIANRSEIACRVVRTAKSRGFETVAVYSEADAGALHVSVADQSVCIGPAPASESYLSIEKILAAAKETGADAIHPGYGFLSEVAAFSAACEEAGIVFIGPTAESIELMGDKAVAKRRMIEAGVPCVPGYHGEDQDDATFIKEAKKIGFPVMIKAASGGGGRGMRLVDSADAMPSALAAARTEAENAFGSGNLILEKALINPRHVEIQVLGDGQGRVLHFGERDCSIQRRHQKVVEESPCPVLGEEQREAMCEAAVRAAGAIDYRGAGTLEFLLDADGHFYFLEMNTRLQVEHPVTEMVTGVDLVGLQLDVAAGHPLSLSQDDIQFNGHAIEVRLYAEDPARDFLPQTGKVLVWEPASGEGVRVDHGLKSGSEISPFYDSMVAKIIAHGATREEARRRLLRAVEETRLLGVISNKGFLIDALTNEVFIGGEATTGFISEAMTGDSNRSASNGALKALACVALIEHASLAVVPSLRGWRSTGAATIPFELEDATGKERLNVEMIGRRYKVRCGEEETLIEVTESDDRWIRCSRGGATERVRYAVEEDRVYLDVGWATASFRDLTLAAAEVAEVGGDGVVKAPTSGKVLAVNVEVGQKVSKNDIVVIVEAMKMENQVLAPVDGVVESVSIKEGDQVHGRQVLVTIAVEE